MSDTTVVYPLPHPEPVDPIVLEGRQVHQDQRIEVAPKPVQIAPDAASFWACWGGVSRHPSHPLLPSVLLDIRERGGDFARWDQRTIAVVHGAVTTALRNQQLTDTPTGRALTAYRDALARVQK